MKQKQPKLVHRHCSSEEWGEYKELCPYCGTNLTARERERDRRRRYMRKKRREERK